MRQHGADWVAHYALTQPDAPALRNLDTDERLTWSQFDRRVGEIAHLLVHDLGLSRGDRIVNVSNGDIRHFLLQFACIRAGLVWAPLNFRHTVAEMASVSRDLAPKLMLTDATWSAVAEDVARQAGIGLTMRWGAGEEFDRRLNPDRRTDAHGGIDPDAPIQILYTSGTTGRPKAVVYTLSTLTWHILNQAEFCATTGSNNHVFVPLPLFHAGGLHPMANPALYAGGQVTVSGRFDPTAAVQFVGDPANGVTHLSLVPVMFQMMVDSPAFALADFSGFRRMLCAGGRLTERIITAFGEKGIQFMTQYGGTETGPTVTSLNPARQDKVRAGSCGQKAMHVEIRLVDEQGNDAALGQPGEIWVRGPAVTPGYIGSGGTLIARDDWLKTGDVAWMDDEGFYYIVDRTKDMYKSGGENVFPGEVERVLAEHPAIAEIAVIGVADAKWGEVGLAIVALAADGHITLEEIRSFCGDKLARYKHPRHLVLVDALPRNVTGKVSKEILREQYGASTSA